MPAVGYSRHDKKTIQVSGPNELRKVPSLILTEIAFQVKVVKYSNQVVVSGFS